MRTLDISWNLYKKYGQTEEIRDYYGLLAIYGLGQTVYEAGDAKWNNYYISILDKYPDSVEPVSYTHLAVTVERMGDQLVLTVKTDGLKGASVKAGFYR